MERALVLLRLKGKITVTYWGTKIMSSTLPSGVQVSTLDALVSRGRAARKTVRLSSVEYTPVKAVDTTHAMTNKGDTTNGDTK